MANSVAIEIRAIDLATQEINKIIKSLSDVALAVNQFSPKVAQSALSMDSMARSAKSLAGSMDDLVSLQKKLNSAMSASAGSMRDFARDVKAASDVSRKLEKDGVGILAFAYHVSKAYQAIALLTSGMRDFIQMGVTFNSDIESSKMGLAALVMQFFEFKKANGEVLDGQERLNKAMQAAEGIQQRLLEASRKTGITYDQLLNAMQAAFGPAFANGVRSIEQLERIVVSATVAVRALKLPAQQVVQEIRSLFEAEQRPSNTLVKVLQLSRVEMDKLRQSGQDVGKYIEDKLVNFLAISGEMTKSWAVATTSLQAAWEQVAGAMTKATMRDVIGDVVEAKNKLLEFRDAASGVGEVFSVLIKNLLGSFRDSLVTVIPGLSDSIKDMGATWKDVFDSIAIALDTFIGNMRIFVAYFQYAIQNLGASLMKAVLTPIAAIMEYLGNGNFRNIVDTLSRHVDKNAADIERIVTAIEKGMENTRQKISGVTGAAEGLSDKVKMALKELGELGAKAAQALENQMERLQQKLAVGFGTGKLAEQIRAQAELQKELNTLRRNYANFLDEKGNPRASFKGTQSEREYYAVEAMAYQVFHEQMAEIDKKYNEKALHEQQRQTEALVREQKRREDELKRVVENATSAQAEAMELLGMESDAAAIRLEDKLRKVYENLKAYYDKFQGPLSEKEANLLKGIQDRIKSVSLFGAGPDDIEMLPVEKVDKELRNIARNAKEVWNDVSRALTDALTQAFSGDFSGAIRSLAEKMLRMFTEYLIAPLQDEILGLFRLQRDPKTGEIKRMVASETGGSTQGTSVVDSTWANYVGAGAAGYGIGSGIGGGDSANRIGGVIGGVGGFVAGSAMGATGGILAGTQLGAIAGPVGMIVGAIIGAIIGELFSPNTEAHVVGVVDQELRKQGSAIQKSVETIYSGLVDVIVTAAPDKASELMGSYRAALAAAFASTRYDIAAGDAEDIQKNYEWLVSTMIPKMAIQAAFGQKGTGLPHGNRDATGGRGGLDWWTTGMDADGNWVQRTLYDPEAPIPKMLSGLGFTAEKIQLLSEELSNTEDPKAFLQKIQNLVSIVVGFNELIGKLNSGRAGAFAELDKTWVDRFNAQGKTLSTGFQNLSLYTGDEQIAKAKELIQATAQWYTDAVNYIGQLRTLSANLLASIDAQLQSIDDSTKTWVELIDQTRVKALTALGAIASETTPEGVQKQAGVAMDAIRSLVSALMEVQNAAENARDSFSAQSEVMQNWNASFDQTMASAAAQFAGGVGVLSSNGILSPDQIASASNDIIAGIQALFEGYTKIHETANAQLETISALQEEIRSFGQSFETAMAAASARFNAAAGGLVAATTPEDLAKYSAAAQDAVKTILDALKGISAAAKSQLSAIDALQARLRGNQDNEFVAMANLVALQNATDPEQIAKLGDAARGAVEAIVSGLQSIIEAAKAAKDSIHSLSSKMKDWEKDTERLTGDAKDNAFSAAGKLMVGGLSASEIQKWSSVVVESVGKIFDSITAKLEAFDSAVASIGETLDGLAQRITDALGGESVDEKLNRLFGRATSSFGAITKDMSPSEISKLATAAMAAVTEGLDILVDRLSTLKGLGKQIADIYDAFSEGEKISGRPLMDYVTGVNDLTEKVAAASKLSGQAQVDAIEDVRASATDLYNAQKEMLDQIAANAVELTKSINQQIWDIGLGEMTPSGQADAVMTRIQELYKSLGTAASPDEVKSVTGEIQSLVTKYLGTFGTDDPNRARAVAWATSILQDTEKAGKEAYSRMGDVIKSANEKVKDQLEKAGTLISGAISSTEVEIKRWETLLKSTRERMEGIQEDLGAELDAWITFLDGLMDPLDAAVNDASSKLETWINWLDNLKFPLEATLTWVGFQIQAFGNALDSIKAPLDAAIVYSANQITIWAKALDGMDFPLRAQVNAAAGEVELWRGMLVDLRTRIEENLNDQINAVAASMALLVPQVEAAKGLFTDIGTTVLPGLDVSVDNTTGAMDRLRLKADELTGAFEALKGSINGGSASSKSTPYSTASVSDIAVTFRRDPGLLVPQVGF